MNGSRLSLIYKIDNITSGALYLNIVIRIAVVLFLSEIESQT